MPSRLLSKNNDTYNFLFNNHTQALSNLRKCKWLLGAHNFVICNNLVRVLSKNINEKVN